MTSLVERQIREVGRTMAHGEFVIDPRAANGQSSPVGER